VVGINCDCGIVSLGVPPDLLLYPRGRGYKEGPLVGYNL